MKSTQNKYKCTICENTGNNAICQYCWNILGRYVPTITIEQYNKSKKKREII